jgi:hypothetical protein
MERRTAMNNQLQQLVFVIFPELVHTIKPSTKTGMYLIKRFSDPKELVFAGIKKLNDIIRKVSRGRLSTDRAIKLYHAAKNSVGITESSIGAEVYDNEMRVWFTLPVLSSINPA